MDRLADLSFVKEAKDLFITGCTGTGKSYIATALGMRACQKGFRVIYTNTYKLMGKLKVAKAKGDILKELKRIEKTDVLILEDFSIHPFDAGSRMSLMDIIEDRYGKKTTILTSQVPVKNWYDLIGDKSYIYHKPDVCFIKTYKNNQITNSDKFFIFTIWFT